MNLIKKDFLVLLTIPFFALNNLAFAESLESQLKVKREASKSKTPKEIKKKMHKGVQTLKESGLADKALGKGKKMPPLNFLNANKKRIALYDYLEKGPVVLTFYRGSWCPYCMLELKAYQALVKDFEKYGATVIAVSPDLPMVSKKTKDKNGLEFLVLSDVNNRAAKLIGLSFKVDDDTRAIYKNFGINLSKNQGNDENTLPMPGTYVIDKKGMVQFSYVDPDYTKRAEPSEVLKVVKSL